MTTEFRRDADLKPARREGGSKAARQRMIEQMHATAHGTPHVMRADKPQPIRSGRDARAAYLAAMRR